MVDIILILFFIIALIVYALYRAFFMSYHDKCYEQMEETGYAAFGSCLGQMGGDYETEYLDYSCINCPYIIQTVFKKGEYDDKT